VFHPLAYARNIAVATGSAKETFTLVSGWRGVARTMIPGDHTMDRTLEQEEATMPRRVGDRYRCEKCGAQLVYEKACPCPPAMPHSEICCGEQMKLVPAK
jgi:hypothetical protein